MAVCDICHQDKQGRQITDALTGAKWFMCYDCKRASGEESGTVTKTQSGTVIITQPSAVSLAKAKQGGVQLVTPLREDVQELLELPLDEMTEEHYSQLDVMLSRVGKARKSWRDRLAPILDPLKDAIRAAKKATEGTDALFKEVDSPMEQMESAIRLKMKDYKTEEYRLKQIADREQQNAARLLQEAAEREAAAKTPKQQQKAQAQRIQAEVQLEQTVERAPVTTYAENSTTRVKKTWKIKDMAKFLAFIAENEELFPCVEVRSPEMNKRYKDDPEGMQSWPGIDIVDDVTIVRR